MGLIKKISESLELRKEEKELKQEERLLLREMAQERLAKKRALEQKQKDKLILRETAQESIPQKNYEKKPKSFDEMLDMKIPCEKIIRLENEDGEIHYFQMGGKDIDGIAFNVERGCRINMPSKFRQLTGDNSGDVHDINPPSGYSDGLYFCKFNGFSIMAFDKRLCAVRDYQGLEDLRKQYGNTITLRQLLLKWKKDNKQFMDIDFETDYEMVKRVYDSEDMFSKSKTEELSK